MINQDELPLFNEESSISDDLIGSLLMEKSSPKEIIVQEDPILIKQTIAGLGADIAQQFHSPLHFGILENQEFNYLLPEKPYLQNGDDDPILASEPQAQEAPSPCFNPRKDSKIDKLAYLEETRAAKIERYRLKKSRRIWNRKISYDCRKIVADSRLRVNGRFVKKSSPLTPYNSVQKTNEPNPEAQLFKELLQYGQHFQDFCL